MQGEMFGGSLPLRLCAHPRWQKSAGHTVLQDGAAWGAVCLQSEVTLPDGSTKSLLSLSSVCVACQGLYLHELHGHKCSHFL